MVCVSLLSQFLHGNDKCLTANLIRCTEVVRAVKGLHFMGFLLFRYTLVLLSHVVLLDNRKLFFTCEMA